MFVLLISFWSNETETSLIYLYPDLLVSYHVKMIVAIMNVLTPVFSTVLKTIFVSYHQSSSYLIRNDMIRFDLIVYLKIWILFKLLIVR